MLALFDFDGTLCRGDSIVPYLRWCVGHGLAPHAQWGRAAWGYLRQLARPGEVASAKAQSLSFIRGHTVEEMDEAARRFFREVLSTRFFPEGAEELSRLRAQGVTTVVLSASADVYMRVLPEFLPVEVVLSTACEVQEGRYTGQIAVNCRGKEKVRRLHAWMAEAGLPPDTRMVAAYGDSAGDAPMLSLAERPVLVNPKRALYQAMPQAETVTWR